MSIIFLHLNQIWRKSLIDRTKVWLFKYTLRYELLRKVKYINCFWNSEPLSPCQSLKVGIPLYSVKFSPGWRFLLFHLFKFWLFLSFCVVLRSAYSKSCNISKKVSSCKSLVVLLAVSVRPFNGPKSLTGGRSLVNLSTLIQVLLNFTSNTDDKGLMLKKKKWPFFLHTWFSKFIVKVPLCPQAN